MAVLTRGITAFVPGLSDVRHIEGFLVRGWTLSSLGALAPQSPTNQRSVGEAGVSTPCGAISTWGNHFFVSVRSDLRRNFRIGDEALPCLGGGRKGGSPEWQLSPPAPRPQPQPMIDRASGVGVSIPCGVVRAHRRHSVFFPELFEVQTYGGIYFPGMGPYLARVALVFFSYPGQPAIG